MEVIELNSDTMTLRLITKEDVPIVVSWLQESKIAPFLQVELEKEVHDFAMMLCEYGEKKSGFILEKGTIPIGMAVLQLLPFVKLIHHCVLFMLIDLEYQKRGFGTYLLSEIEKKAKEDFKLERIELELFDNPYQSWFEKKGYLAFVKQEFYLNVGGQFRHRILLKKEF